MDWTNSTHKGDLIIELPGYIPTPKNAKSILQAEYSDTILINTIIDYSVKGELLLNTDTGNYNIKLKVKFNEITTYLAISKNAELFITGSYITTI